VKHPTGALPATIIAQGTEIRCTIATATGTAGIFTAVTRGPPQMLPNARASLARVARDARVSPRLAAQILAFSKIQTSDRIC
jgi:hypothetical protein